VTGTPLADLLAAAGQDWHVEHGEATLGMWTAERHRGSELRYIVARSAAELRLKILAADREEEAS